MHRVQSFGDKFAIFLSALCVIHCLTTPLIIVLPALGGLLTLDHHAFHELMLFFVVPVGVIALMAGYRHHHSIAVLIGGFSGLLCIMIAALAGHSYLGFLGETLLSIVGSLIIIGAHLVNFRYANSSH